MNERTGSLRNSEQALDGKSVSNAVSNCSDMQSKAVIVLTVLAYQRRDRRSRHLWNALLPMFQVAPFIL